MSEPTLLSTPADLFPALPVGDDVVTELARVRARRSMFGADTETALAHRFTLLEHVGTGGMGSVFAAHDERLQRRVAVKLVSSRCLGADADRWRERLVAEARAMARVNHPNVATVFEVGSDGRLVNEQLAVFIVMEYVDGLTLREWIARAPRTALEILDVYLAAGEGLAAVHEAGLTHRDFKPENVMIDRAQRVLVMDFGIALDSAASPASFALRRPAGTPAYIAPEQWDGERASAASDQYAFCVSLHEALWGARLRVGAPVSTRLDAPRHVRLALQRGLRLDPSQRHATLRALLEDLRGPRRSSPLLRASIVAAPLLGAFGIFGTDSTPDCDTAAMGNAWTPDDASSLRAAFERTSVAAAAQQAQHVVDRLDVYAAQWAVERDSVCGGVRTADVESAGQLDRQRRCLDRRVSEVRALVEALTRADATAVELAADAVADLIPPARCADPTFLGPAEPPHDSAIVAEVEAIEDELASIAALSQTGQLERGRQAARRLSVRALAVPYPPIQARVVFVRGELEAAAGEPTAAVELLEAAYFQSLAVGNAREAASAALWLVSITTRHTNEFEQARRWLRLARIEVESRGASDLADDLLHSEVQLLLEQGDLSEALRGAERRLVDARASCGDVCDRTQDAYAEVSAVYTRLERLADALDAAAASARIAEELHGPEHDAVAAALLRLANAQHAAGRSADAVDNSSRALAIRERVLHPNNVNLALTRAVHGAALTGLGRNAEAIVELSAAREVLLATAGPMQLAQVDTELGAAYQAEGDFAQAQRALDRAAQTLALEFPDGHPTLAVVLSNAASVLVDRGLLDDALQQFEEALAMRTRTVTGDDPTQGLFAASMGTVLVRLGRRAEAIRRYQQALALTGGQRVGAFEVWLRVALAKQLWVENPDAAKSIVAEGSRRCEQLDPDESFTECADANAWLQRHSR